MNRRDILKVSAGLALASAANNIKASEHSTTQSQAALNPPPWKPRPEDCEFFERELESFLPDRIFDAHCHIWNDPENKMNMASTSPETVGFEQYLSLMDELHPRRKMSALFLPMFIADTGKKELHLQNEWVSQNLKQPNFRGSFVMTPDDDPEWVRQEMKRLKLTGLKCYHLFAKSKPTWEADIPEYLPEPFVKMAHEEGFVITLHMVKSRAVADSANIHWIRHYCKTYPNMALILAHTARAFQPAHALEGLPQLTGFDNLYVDTSANPEPIAHQAVMRTLGHQKMLYGTDLPVSHMRGRSLAVADTFLWLYEDAPVWNEKHKTIKPVFIGLEVLRSLKWACWAERLPDTAVEDIFHNNAAKLFNLT